MEVVPIDKKTLEDYKRLGDQITALEDQIQKLEAQAAKYEFGAVKGSNPDFPYQPMAFHVSGYNIRTDEEKRQRIENLKIRLGKKKVAAEEKRLVVQEFIAGIEDPTIQLIFTYRYIDGMSQGKIGRKLHLDRSRISRKIDDYLQNAHKAQKAQV